MLSNFELKPVLTQCDKNTEAAAIFIDVSGAVNKPGMYQLPVGSRVGDAIHQAGGFNDEVDSNYIASILNAADLLDDGDKVFIPSQDARAANDRAAQESEPLSSEPTNEVSINEASLNELQTLPQIGEKRAKDIISGRPYKSVEHLVSSEVITQKIFDEIKALISL